MLETVSPNIGTGHRGFLRVIGKMLGGSSEYTGTAWFQDPIGFHWFYEDFNGPGSNLITPYDVSATGTPTTGIVDDATGGVYGITLTNNSQVEAVVYHNGDNLIIQGNLPFAFACRVRIPTAAPAANQDFVFGLGSAATQPWNSVTRSAWLRITGTGNILAEYDDNTTDTSYDTGIAPAVDTYYWFGVTYGGGRPLEHHFLDGYGNKHRKWDVAARNEVTNAAFGANNLQPFMGLLKTTGATTPKIHIDQYGFFGGRAQ